MQSMFISLLYNLKLPGFIWRFIWFSQTMAGQNWICKLMLIGFVLLVLGASVPPALYVFCLLSSTLIRSWSIFCFWALSLVLPNFITNFKLFSTHWRCELAPYSQRANMNYLTVGSFWGHSVSSQWTHKMSSHCELALCFLWVCILTSRACSELFLRSSWRAHHAVVSVSWSPVRSPC